MINMYEESISLCHKHSSIDLGSKSRFLANLHDRPIPTMQIFQPFSHHVFQASTPAILNITINVVGEEQLHIEQCTPVHSRLPGLTPGRPTYLGLGYSTKGRLPIPGTPQPRHPKRLGLRPAITGNPPKNSKAQRHQKLASPMSRLLSNSPWRWPHPCRDYYPFQLELTLRQHLVQPPNKAHTKEGNYPSRVPHNPTNPIS